MFTEKLLKNHWKHLKTQYKKELEKKQKISTTEKSNELESTWKYMELMAFMKDELMPQTNKKWSEDILKQNKSNDKISKELEICRNNLKSKQNTSISYIESPSLSDTSISKMLITDNSQTEGLKKLENRKGMKIVNFSKEFQSNEEFLNDDDYMYLMSILPTMKKLNDVQKLRFRGKINEWLLDEITRNEYVKNDNKIHQIYKPPGSGSSQL